MKKRLLSLLLAVVLCIGLLPVGALAADEITVNTDLVDDNGEITMDTGYSRRGFAYSSSDTAATIDDSNWHVIQADVTVGGDLTLGGGGGLVLGAGATLTVNGALILKDNSSFHIYGRTGESETGKLIINHTGDGAAIRSDSAGVLTISSGKLEISSTSGELVKNVKLDVSNTKKQGFNSCTVMKATRTDTSGSTEELKYEDWAGIAPSETDLKGSNLVIEYCEHDDCEFIPDKGSTTTHHMHCKACGFTWTSSGACFEDGALSGIQSNGETGHTLKCICGRETIEPHNEVAPGEVEAVPTLDGKGHVSKSCVCGYTSEEPEAHTYIKNTNGSCDKCGFMPFMSDSEGNLYDKDSYQAAFEKAADSNGAVTLTLVSEVTGEGANIWTKSIEFNYPGKSVTLDMGGITLSSTGEAALLVSGGELIIQNAATLEGASASGELSSTPSIKVTDGALTFNGTVNATGGAKNSSAAPAILVEGGTVTFNQTVTATAAVNEEANAAIAPAIKVTGSGKAIFNGTVKATGGLNGTTGNPRQCQPAILADQNGELEFNGDLNLYGGLTVTGDATLTHGLTKGLFYSKPTGASSTTGYAVSVEGSTVYKNGIYGNVNKLLADKHVFVKIAPKDADDKYLTASYQYLAWDVTIEEHEHEFDAENGYKCECGVSCDHPKYENGACTVCGKPCEHGNVDSYPTGHICRDCGQKMLVQNTFGSRDDPANFKFAYFTSLKDAMDAATEDGWTVKLLDDIDDIGRGIDIYEKNSGTQTITLDLNGKNITGSNPIWIGKPNNNIISTTTLKIVGSGNISLGNSALIVSEKSTLDLEDWTRGTIDIVSVSCNGNTGDEGSLIVGENDKNDIYIGKLLYQSWSLSTIKNAKLSGGTYGSINMTLTDDLSPGILFGTLLAPGYAFQYTDGTFVDYAAKAEYSGGGVIYNVKVVKCTTHVDAKSVDADGNITDGADNLCDYCNTDLTANTVATLMVDGATYYYTDLPSAVAKANTTGGTIQLRQDVTGLTEKLDINHIKAFDITLDLNGHTISGTVKTGNTLLAVSTFGTVTICDTSSAQTGKIVGGNGGGYAVYVSDGKLIITGGTFEGTDVAEMEGLPGQAGYALGADGSELVTINGGTFNSPVDAKDKLIVRGGTFNGAVTINARGATITGGTFNGAFSMSAQPDVFSGGMFKEQASFSNVSNILTGGTFEKGLTADRYIVKLLAVSKDYKMTGTENDWLNVDGSTYKESTDQNVTVTEAPFHSLTLTANGESVAIDEDGRAYVTVEYGQNIDLTVACEGSMEKPYLTWYNLKLNDEGEIECTTGTIENNDEATLSLSADDLIIGKHGYAVAFSTGRYGSTAAGYTKGINIFITVTPRDLKNATVEYYTTNNQTVVTYNPLNNHICGLLISKVTLDGVELKEGTDYNISGNTAAEVGKYTAILTAKSDSTKCKGTLEIEWKVVPYALPEPSFEGNQMYTKTYDGTTTLPKEYKFQALFPNKEPGSSEVDWRKDEDKNNYEVTAAEFVSPDAGENKPINQTITLKNENFVFEPTEKIKVEGITTTDKTVTHTNFTLSEAYPTLGTTFNIKKATVPDFNNEVTLDIVNDLENTYTIDLPALPALKSPKTYGDITYTVASQSLEHGYATLGQPTVKQVDGKYQLCLTVPAVKYDQETSIGTILVKVTTTNYNDVVLTVNLNAVNKFQPAVAVQAEPKTVTYGTTLANITPVFEAIYDGQPVGGTVTWDLSADTMPGTDTKYLAWTFTPSDPDKYFGATGNASITVTPATLTGAPKYTAITASGKKLSDAGLAANESWPAGTLQWVDKDGKVLDPATTEVKANTAYQWKFTPDSKNYDPIEDSITLYYVSTGGGGSTTYPVSTPSKTENGSVSVSPKNASRGDTVTITVKPDDGYVLDDLTVTDKNGNDLKLTDKGNGKYTFTMPAGKVEVKASFAEEAETSPFADVATDAYYYEAVKWAAEQGITGGIGNNLFGPNYPCTRAQIVTFLWRAAGSPEPKDMSSFADVSTDSYYAKAVAWAVENGITSGTGDGKFSPDATCTRAQAVTFLARALNAKATSAAEFSDVPTDSYFAEAVAWAASNGVTAGIGGGLFGPNNDCTRAQIVTFLFRAYNK